MKKTVLIITILFITFKGYTQTFTDNYITYNITSSTTVEITDYDFINGGANVSIPAVVTHNSTIYNVITISSDAFRGDTTTGEQITSVIIPSSITTIGANAFSYNLLTSVTIPNSVIQIGNLAFRSNTLLTNVTLSDNLTNIPLAAFQFCALNNITIPDNVTSIQSSAFESNQLTTITIPSNVNIISSRAFFNNPLTDIYSLATSPASIITAFPPNTTTDSFSGNRSTINLHVPTGTSATYTAALWIGFNSVTEDATLSIPIVDLQEKVQLITSSDSISLLLPNNIRLKNYILYNISGVSVASGNTSEIATSSLANGVYVLKLDFHEGTAIKKVIIN